MTPGRWKRARELFDAALDRSPSEADEYLHLECGEDRELLSQVRRMLAEHERSGALDRPVWEPGPAASMPPVFSPGQVVAGRYRVIRYLSRGGMGEVYEAEHPLLPDHVALKTLLPSIASDEAMIERFKQEIRLARKIAHPNVCRVFDVEWHEGEGGIVYFLTMEFLPGETLATRIERQGPMDTAEALPLVEQMSEALDAAHSMGVIHRDFKTSNVMLVPAGETVRAVVTDFGLARAVGTGNDRTATLTNNVAGTLDFMAPELLTGAVATARSDIYALGMVAYKMVTGRLPFAGETALTAAFMRAQTPVPSPRSLMPELDVKWDEAILRALERDPGQRFACALDFPRAIHGEPVPLTAPVPGLSRRKALAVACAIAAAAAGWTGWRAWTGNRGRPSPEAARLYQQGVDDIHAGAYFAATKALDQAVQLAPQFSPARARLAESWLELDLPEKAGREFLPVHRLDNSGLSSFEQLQIEAIDLTITREFASAVEKYKEMLARGGSEPANLEVDLGRAYEKAGEPDKAIEAFRRAAEGPSHSAAAWLRLGVLYSQRKKLAESEAAFAEAERRYQQTSNLEGLTELTLQRAVAANRNQKYQDASALIQKAMERARDTGNVHQEIRAELTLANVSYKAGNSDLAEKLAREALAAAQANQMEPLTIRGFINLGASHFGKGDFGGAEQNFQQALALASSTNSPQLAALSRLSLATLHDALHQSQHQLEEAREALAYYEPNHWVQETFQCLLLLVRGEEYQENFSAARESAQRLLDASRKAQDRAQMAQAYEALGNVLSEQENYPQALENYQQFLSATSDPIQIGYAAIDCAITLARLGRYPEAMPALARAEEAASKMPQFRPLMGRSHAEVALIRNEWREAAGLARGMLQAANLRPLTATDLNRILGLALLRSGNLKSGLEKCEEALAAARKQDDPGELFDTRLAVLEARLALRDRAAAAAMFQELQPDLEAHPESRWRALALMTRSDNQYSGRAREALSKLDGLWGHENVLQYLKRSDIRDLSWPLLSNNSAEH